MEIAIKCDSQLLQRALTEYLNEYIVADADATLYVCDKVIYVNKPLFLIGHSVKSDLKIPFKKEKLVDVLKKFYLKTRKNKVQLSSKQRMRDGRV